MLLAGSLLVGQQPRRTPTRGCRCPGQLEASFFPLDLRAGESSSTCVGAPLAAGHLCPLSEQQQEVAFVQRCSSKGMHTRRMASQSSDAIDEESCSHAADRNGQALDKKGLTRGAAETGGIGCVHGRDRGGCTTKTLGAGQAEGSEGSCGLSAL